MAIAAEHIPADIAEAIAAVRAITVMEALELHAERTGTIVALFAEHIQLPARTGDEPQRPHPRAVNDETS